MARGRSGLYKNRPLRPRFSLLAIALAPLAGGATTACSLLPDDGDAVSAEVMAGNMCARGGQAFRFAHGDDGHADPLGAGRARQARAGRIKDPGDIVQPADARHKIRPGDFLIANDKVAVYIESEGISDGYIPFGGEILAIEPLGADGRPSGLSYYNESAILFGLETFAPDRVTVIKDGSDGGEAVVRASGVLKIPPQLDAFGVLFPDRYGFPAALDYVLEPGSTRLKLRVNLANTRPTPVDFSKGQHTGFFQSSRSQPFTESFGFDQPRGEVSFIAFDSGTSSFLGRSLLGNMNVSIDLAGLQIFASPALQLEACSRQSVDYFELIGAAGGIDGVLEAKRAALGEPAWREVRGVVREDGGSVLGGAVVHATDTSGYLTRAVADEQGKFVLHVPPGTVSLTPTMKGWNVPNGTPVAAGSEQVVLTLPRRATLDVSAVDRDSQRPLPVRVQVIPDGSAFKAPASFGIKDEPDDRLYREYVMSGHAALPVPPGGHRVVVTRGYEYELYDAPVLATEGRTTRVNAELARTVDSTGVMCADFHIHTLYSADSSDPIEKKVRGAIADGLEIPVSSEHEYIVDFDPTIRRLGLGAWAFGMASEELTTFSWGHFGVVPLREQPDAVNHGAIDWTGKKPPQLFKELGQRPERPLVIVNHPSDSAMGYFSMAGFDRETTTGDPELWSDDFSAVEVFNDSDFDQNREGTVQDWFALLNAGKIRWAVGSSDSHDISGTPVGYPRTCMYFGHDDPRRLTPERVRDVMRAGTAVISGGLSMTVEGPGGVLPGGTAGAGEYKVVVASPAWLTPSALEVIVDGVTTEEINLLELPSSGPGKRYELRIDVRAASSRRSKHWVVFHARGQGDLAPLHPRRRPFAVSNPIFF